MKHIYIDTQSAWDYFIDNIAPYAPTTDSDFVECQEWFDAWCTWLVGNECIDGDSISYQHSNTPEARKRLDMFGIKYEVE